MYKSAIIFAAIVLSACAPFQTIDELRANAASGQIGCDPKEIEIGNNQQLTWTATCKGKKFFCSTGDGTSCKPQMQ